VTSNTAFTLEQGVVEVGIMTPLTIGVVDELQVALHPVLLLLGQPYVAARWRVTRPGDIGVALNLGASWSFIRREDRQGRPASPETEGVTGFPGTVQLTTTVTLRVGEGWLLSVGAGPAVDFLGERAVTGLVELHGSVHWIIDRTQLLALHASGYLGVTGDDPLVRPLAQLMYAVALSRIVHLGVGVGVGSFIFDTSETERRTLKVFPVADLWFRF